VTDISDIVKQVALAHNDGNIKAIAVVFCNEEGEPEIHYAVSNTLAYGVNFGLDVIKAGILSDVLRGASKQAENRE
jgi:hypothetical protein